MMMMMNNDHEVSENQVLGLGLGSDRIDPVELARFQYSLLEHDRNKKKRKRREK